MEKLLTLGIFIKSAVDQKNLKFGVVVTWVISIVQKNIRCHSNICLEGIELLTPAVETIYSYNLQLR